MMRGRQVVDATGLLLRLAPYVGAALLVGYVGGPSLVVLVASVLLTAVMLQRRTEIGAGAGVLAGLLVNLAWLSIYAWKILPLALQVPVVRSVVAHPLVQVGFRATDYPSNSVGLYWLGSLLALGAPGILSLAWLIRRRAKYVTFREPVLDRLTGVAALIPFAVVAYLKWSHPWLAPAFTMGGDGRNQFLSIEEIRVTAIGIPSPLDLTTPMLSNGIGSLLSSGNGASGTLQRGDLFAMVSVYVLSASVLIVATMTGFTNSVRARATEMREWTALPLVVTAFLLATSSLVLSTSLYDGFMSLYFGAAVLGATLVVAAILAPGGLKVLLIACGLLSEIGAYTFLAPVLGVILVVEIYRWMWTVAPTRRRAKVLAAWTFLLISGLAFLLPKKWSAFEVIAIIPGAISPIGSSVVWLLLLLAICLAFLGNRESRWAGLTAVFALASCLFVLFLIERLSVNVGPGNSYYGSKTIVGTVGGVLCLSYVPLADALRSFSQKGIGRIPVIVGLVAAALIPVAIADSASTLSRPWLEVRRGRAIPDDLAIEEVVERWGDEPYVFFRFADNPPDVAYPDAAADRALNFWSPISWGRDGDWVSMWLWAYNEIGTLDADVMCNPVYAGVKTVYTRDPALRSEVLAVCGGYEVEFVVLPRVGTP